jgi:hypothetical protein
MAATPYAHAAQGRTPWSVHLRRSTTDVDFTIPEELTALRKSYGTFLDREVRPVEE